MCIQWDTSQPFKKKEWNFAICGNMSGAWGHFAKWNKSERERQIFYFIYMWNLKYETKNKIKQHKNNR